MHTVFPVRYSKVHLNTECSQKGSSSLNYIGIVSSNVPFLRALKTGIQKNFCYHVSDEYFLPPSKSVVNLATYGVGAFEEGIWWLSPGKPGYGE